jgi:hypothetical protein
MQTVTLARLSSRSLAALRTFDEPPNRYTFIKRSRFPSREEAR